MTIRYKPQVKTWCYRFSRDRRSYSEGGFQTKRQAEEAQGIHFNKVIQKKIHPEQVGQDMAFQEAGQWFFDEYTIKRKRSWMNDRGRLKVIGQFFEGKKLSAITPEDIQALREYLKRRGLSVHTVNHYQALLKAMFNTLRKFRKYYGDNPTRYVEMERVPKARVRFLYPAEEMTFTPVVRQNPKLWPHYFVALHTGMRLREICYMRVKDVTMSLRQIFVPNSKSNRSRYVPMSDELVAFIQEAIKDKNADAYVLHGYGHMTVSHRFSKLCKDAGLLDFTSHALRHTFAATLLGKGVPIYKVSKILGHSSVVVTESHYGHLSMDHLRDAVKCIEGVVSGVLAPVLPSGNRLHPSCTQ